jgi:hypothetical protein
MGLLSYVAKEVSRLLKIGKNAVSLSSTVECTSFQDVKLVDGKLSVVGMKDKEFPWITPTPQIAVHFVADSGSHVHRFSEKGYAKWNDLSVEEQESGKFSEEEGYACKMTKKGLDRIESPKATATCTENIEKFLFALNKGRAGDVDVDSAIANKNVFIVEIVNDPYKGKNYLVANSFSAIKTVAGDESDELSS